MKRVELVRSTTVVVRLAVLLSAFLVLVKSFNLAVGMGNLGCARRVAPLLRIRLGDKTCNGNSHSSARCGGS